MLLKPWKGQYTVHNLVLGSELAQHFALRTQGLGQEAAPDPPCVDRLVIWPGFTTSILQYENNIMLCTDVSHKVLRSETVLDFMFNLYQQTEEHKFQEQVSKELIGLIVLTKYGLASS